MEILSAKSWILSVFGNMEEWPLKVILFNKIASLCFCRNSLKSSSRGDWTTWPEGSKSRCEIETKVYHDFSTSVLCAGDCYRHENVLFSAQGFPSSKWFELLSPCLGWGKTTVPFLKTVFPSDVFYSTALFKKVRSLCFPASVSRWPLRAGVKLLIRAGWTSWQLRSEKHPQIFLTSVMLSGIFKAVLV